MAYFNWNSLKNIHQALLNYFAALKHHKIWHKNFSRVLTESAKKRSLFYGENQLDVVLNQAGTRPKLLRIIKRTLGKVLWWSGREKIRFLVRKAKSQPSATLYYLITGLTTAKQWPLFIGSVSLRHHGRDKPIMGSLSMQLGLKSFYVLAMAVLRLVVLTTTIQQVWWGRAIPLENLET